MTDPFLDIHTHLQPDPAHGITEKKIYNLDYTELGLGSGQSIPEMFSAAIHPWNIDRARIDDDMQLLASHIAEPRLRMIGECGLDRRKGPDVRDQTIALEKQLDLAKEWGKPVLLHCVGAFQELIAACKRVSFTGPKIVHGYRKSPELAHSLLKQGFSLSFGAALLRPTAALERSFKLVHECGAPLFLETDDSHTPIAAIYSQAADLLKISEEALKDVIFASWKKIGLIDDGS